jgi:hypothetical protein
MPSEVAGTAGISTDDHLKKVSKGVAVESTDTCFVMMPFANPIGGYYETIYEPDGKEDLSDRRFRDPPVEPSARRRDGAGASRFDPVHHGGMWRETRMTTGGTMECVFMRKDRAVISQGNARTDR